MVVALIRDEARGVPAFEIWTHAPVGDRGLKDRLWQPSKDAERAPGRGQMRNVLRIREHRVTGNRHEHFGRAPGKTQRLRHRV